MCACPSRIVNQEIMNSADLNNGVASATSLEMLRDEYLLLQCRDVIYPSPKLGILDLVEARSEFRHERIYHLSALIEGTVLYALPKKPRSIENQILPLNKFTHKRQDAYLS